MPQGTNARNPNKATCNISEKNMGSSSLSYGQGFLTPRLHSSLNSLAYLHQRL